MAGRLATGVLRGRNQSETTADLLTAASPYFDATDGRILVGPRNTPRDPAAFQFEDLERRWPPVLLRNRWTIGPSFACSATHFCPGSAVGGHLAGVMGRVS